MDICITQKAAHKLILVWINVWENHFTRTQKAAGSPSDTCLAVHAQVHAIWIAFFLECKWVYWLTEEYLSKQEACARSQESQLLADVDEWCWYVNTHWVISSVKKSFSPRGPEG